MMNWIRRALCMAGRPDRRVQQTVPLSGGCIATVERWILDDDEEFVVKSNTAAFADAFAAEADGLSALSATQAIRVPEVLANGSDDKDDRAFLILAPIGRGHWNVQAYSRFGYELAQLHAAATDRPTFGWHRDNTIGATAQLNQPTGSWSEFFAERRLRPQLGWAVDAGLAGTKLRDAVERLIGRLSDWLPPSDEPPSLLHGDLWSGNVLCDPSGAPVLIDPAVYRGDREAEFGMIELYGNFPPVFYDAYNEANRLRDGWRDRVAIYTLYHLLNHLNLFGAGYRRQCEELAARWA